MMQIFQITISISKLRHSKRCIVLLKIIDLNQDGDISELLLDCVLLMMNSLMLGDRDLYFTDILHSLKGKDLLND
jgi:hypothetical protein